MTQAAVLIARIRDFGELVKFSHTVFLFPFALSAVVLAQQVNPLTWPRFLWIVLALVAARSAAMVMNRIADRAYDARNPRTRNRSLVTGRVSLAQAWAYLFLAVVFFLLAAWHLGPLCLALSPVALAWTLGYSYAKRFTVLVHLWLGSATALAPLGAWLAMTGVWDWRAVLLALAVAGWVGGFDVIYACQDLEIDRAEGLCSLPARLGIRGALWASRAHHLVTVAGFLALGPLFGLGKIYLAGVLLVGGVLALEQILVARRRANIPLAFFTLNGVVSVFFFLMLCLDRLVGE